MCVGVLTYLPDSEAVVREFVRIVRPGGAVVLTQRTDLHDERAFGPLLERIARDGLITDLSISEPRRYLPANDDYADTLRVRYVQFRVPA